jgi:hypothetical protein
MKTIALLAALSIASLGLVGCTGDDTQAAHESPPDSGSQPDSTAGNDSGGGTDGGGGDSGNPEPDCYMNPKTHHEIINACTDAQAVDKTPSLPLRQPDGSLPPLP